MRAVVGNKMTLLPITAPKSGDDPVEPGRMSFTRTVPAVVPSVRHNSEPPPPAVEAKYIIVQVESISPGETVTFPGALSGVVPAAVPSDFHNSPEEPVTAAPRKTMPLPTAVNSVA